MDIFHTALHTPPIYKKLVIETVCMYIIYIYIVAIEKKGPFGPDISNKSAGKGPFGQTLLLLVRLPSQTGQWGSQVIQLPSATPVGGATRDVAAVMGTRHGGIPLDLGIISCNTNIIYIINLCK